MTWYAIGMMAVSTAVNLGTRALSSKNTGQTMQAPAAPAGLPLQTPQQQFPPQFSIDPGWSLGTGNLPPTMATAAAMGGGGQQLTQPMGAGGAGQQPVQQVEPNPMGAAIGGLADVAKFMALRQPYSGLAIGIAPAHTPRLEGGTAVPVRVTREINRVSPIQRWAMSLRRL